MGEVEIITALDQIFKTNILSLVGSFIFATTVFMLLKMVAESLTGYIQFRLDKHLAIGSPIEVYGKQGRIDDITIFTITVQTDCGFIRVPTKSWRASKFIVLKDNLVLRNRRKGD